jgi:pyridoxal phosphate enzyme (YggS family)
VILADNLPDRLEAVTQNIAEATARAGRNLSEITTVVVTKFHPVSLLEDLLKLGVSNFGENRHQEAQEKAKQLGDRDITWHFVGQLQSKKARQVRRYAHVIHSIDRPNLVDLLASDEIITQCFIQVNLTKNPARAGVIDLPSLERLAEKVKNTQGLQLLGLMGVAPLNSDPRRAFATLREASERIRTIVPTAYAISAGMSHDYPDAIAEGATHLRIGTAITGNRPHAG